MSKDGYMYKIRVLCHHPFAMSEISTRRSREIHGTKPIIRGHNISYGTLERRVTWIYRRITVLVSLFLVATLRPPRIAASQCEAFIRMLGHPRYHHQRGYICSKRLQSNGQIQMNYLYQEKKKKKKRINHNEFSKKFNIVFLKTFVFSIIFIEVQIFVFLGSLIY